MKRYKRVFWAAILNNLPLGAKKRADIIRKYNLFGSVGDNCYIQSRKFPLHSELVFLHNNICIGSDVCFVTHDASHMMLNRMFKTNGFIEKVGCIEVMDNVFIGSGTRIVNNIRIGNNVIIGSGSLINKDIPDNSVYSGNPAKYICDFEDYVGLLTDYSEQFKIEYGLKKIHDLDKDIAAKIYDNFLKEKTRKKK